MRPSNYSNLLRRRVRLNARQSQGVRRARHGLDDERDMLSEIDVQFRRAIHKILAIDDRCEALRLHLFAYRRYFQADNALVGTYQGRRRNHPGDLVAGVEPFREEVVARVGREIEIVMCQNCVDDARDILRSQNRVAGRS